MERSSFSKGLAFAFGTLLLAVTLLAPIGSALALDPPSIKDKAPGATSPVVTTIGENLPDRIDAAYQNIRWEMIGSGTMAFMNAMQTFFGQIAYDAADYLATGGKGRSALFYEKGFEGYLKDVGSSAAGEFIGSLSQSSFFRTAGFDLCRPNVQNLLRIQLSLGQFLGARGGVNGAFQRPTARCDFNDIVNNYEKVYQTLSNDNILKNVDASLNTTSNDLGVSFLIFNRAQEFTYQRKETAEKDRKEGNGYQGLRDIVSGRVKTPSDTIREEANQILVKDPKANQSQINSFILQQAWEMGPIRLATYTASVFLNTFTSKMLSRVFDKGIGIFTRESFADIDTTRSPDDLLIGNAKDTRKANIDLRTPNLFQNKAYNVLADMQSCPQGRGTWNCVIDEGLSQALNSEGNSGSYTVREAIDRNYLKKSWRLFPSTNVREERDPLCYTYGYCSGNLRKLRLMRIVPVGFEFAANDPKNIERCATDQGCITLGEVVSKYTECNAQGKKDADHPWCKLIDPNWAITSFPQQCALTGFGDVMLSNGLPQRREECQDIQTCLRRNDQGECTGGYGQCVTEKSVYRFGGEECSAKFASCRTYGQRNSRTEVSFLRNTLDYAQCSDDNTGCLWYSTERDAANPAPNAWIGTATEGPRIYLDKTLAACAATGEGCTKLLAVAPGEKALNLIANSSFERVGNDGTLNDWQPVVGTSRGFVRPTVTAGNVSADGAVAGGFSGGFTAGYRQVVDLQPGRNYVISGFVRRDQAAGSEPVLSLGMRQYVTREDAVANRAPLAPSVLARDFKTLDCSLASTTDGTIQATVAASLAASTTWSRVECTFTANVLAEAGAVTVRGTNTLVDALMLEEGDTAGRYIDGVNQALETVYHKVAPDEFACKGDASDPAACGNYAQACRQTEANCSGYTDTNGSFPEVAAKLGSNDSCPAACVGYAEYRKLPSAFDLVQNAVPALNDATEARSAAFIPTTAQQCSQEAVGCEAFTVVDAVAEGGENQAYFKDLRFCERPSDTDSATYFTWEGSDSAGYQLRTWSLKKRTADKPGEVPPSPEAATVTAASGPRIIVKRSADLFSQKNPLDCNEANWRTGADQDCRQFYDASGNVFYRYYSQTVLSTNDCRSFRLNDRSADDCTKTGGQYNAEQRSCVYQAYAPESGSCTAAFAGCRAYAGAEAGNIRTVFSANGTVPGALTGATISSESLLVGDQSYRVNVDAGRSASVSAVASTTSSGLYRVSFWAKASASSTLVVRAATTQVGDTGNVVGTIRLTTEWQQVSFGLFDGAAGTETRLLWTASAASAAPAAVFLDQINVQQLRDVVFVRENSWQTPAQCDQNVYGVPEPQAMLGCREYRNRDGQNVTARQFSQLCRPQAIGCREFIDTRNAEDPYRATFTLSDLGGASVTERPAAKYVYLIDDVSRRCNAANATCRAFGKPVLSADRRTVTRYETVYMKDDVTKYGDALCKPSELFCEEFATDTGKEYFKDPQNHSCQYREQVAVRSINGIPDGTYNGWFITGEDRPCYPDALASGQLFQVLRSGDTTPGDGYQGWGATCPAEQTECTEFRDTNDKTAAEPTGRSYYFVNNDQVDTRSCNGTVDPSLGCVLLRNMSKSNLTYSTEATLAAYQANNLKPVAATDCQANPSAPGCGAARTGRCVGTRVTTRYRVVRRSGTELSGIVIDTDQVVVDGTTSGPYSGNTCVRTSDCEAEAAPVYSGTLSYTGGISVGRTVQQTHQIESQVNGIACERPSANDANEIVKVRIDRDCAQWLGCSTGETVYDPSTNRYRDTCTQVALCDRGSEQSGGAAYCSNYVNRTTTSTEPVLTAGAYFDAAQYTSRPAQVNARDYSGFSVPNAFQAVDLQSRSLSKDGLGIASDNISEQRLVVAVKMPPLVQSTLGTRAYAHIVPPNRPNQAEAISPTDAAAYSGVAGDIRLCRHRGTGIIGYFKLEEARLVGQEVNCYLSFQGSQAAGAFTALNNRLRAAEGTEQDLTLDEAYPRSLCRAYPESDAPFSNDVVDGWNSSVNPMRASALKAGYESANYCAFGESCSCSYKRVEYAGIRQPMFFDPESQAVPPGLCMGGPRDGQSCLPTEVFNLSGNTSTAAQIALASNNAQTCGPANGGGRCVAFSRAEIVRGVMGSCLEYDTTHGKGRAGDETFPCLVWNPSPIVGGQGDPYHYVQTAGYFPPQNSGQYYCASDARTPKSYALDASSFLQRQIPIQLAGLSYNDDYVSDANDFGTDGNEPGGYFDNLSPLGSAAAYACEDADDRQDDDGNFQTDPLALKIVATGRGIDKNYAEAFYGVNPTAFARKANNMASNVYPTNVQRRAAMDEKNMSYIEVRPFRNPNGNGRLVCGYQEDWVDGVRVDDYDDITKVAEGDRAWQQAFLSEEDLQMYLTRGSEKILTRSTSGADANKPLQMPCTYLSDETPGAAEADPGRSSGCYFKTWEIGYRSKGQESFLAFEPSNPDGPTAAALGFDGLLSPQFKTCKSEKPYYGIRAVFQTEASGQADQSTIVPSQVRGPWRLIGFWVTACGGRAQIDNRFIFMNVTVQNADICRELAEVRSTVTSQDAAFTDRVWKQSTYSVPVLGIQYGQSFAPFSSALNTGPADEQPLYQTGGRIAGSSAIRPPTFLASGFQTYSGPAYDGAPKNRYAYLSNLFARIYRIYRYNEQRVGPADSVCTAGVFKGRKCVADAGTEGNPVSVDCRPLSGAEACDAGSPPPDGTKLCNALSGINSGNSCGSAPDSCHLYATDPTAGSPRPLLTACNLQTGWTRSGDNYVQPSGGEPVNKLNAQYLGAFRCAAGAIRLRDPIGTYLNDDYLRGRTTVASSYGGAITTVNTYDAFGIPQLPGALPPAANETIYCSDVQAVSAECPIEVIGRCERAAGVPDSAPGTCNVGWMNPDGETVSTETQISCMMNSDCSFNSTNFWRNGPGARYVGRGEVVDGGNAWRDSWDGRFGIFRSQRANSVVSVPEGGSDPAQNCTTEGGCPVSNLALLGQTSRLFMINTSIGEQIENYAFPGAPTNVYNQRSGTSLGGRVNVLNQVKMYTIGSCDSITATKAQSPQFEVGRCADGSVNAGSICVRPKEGVAQSRPYSDWSQTQGCGTYTPATPEEANDGCAPVSAKRCSDGRSLPDACPAPYVVQLVPQDDCAVTGGARMTAEDYWDAATTIDPLARNLSNDNNICTVEVGYQPDRSICPNPDSEFCGLIAYDMRLEANGQPSNPASLRRSTVDVPLPTDVTLGLYTPSFLGIPVAGVGGVSESNYQYIDYYTPRPPRIASPMTTCAQGTTCGAQDLDKFSFNGITQGIVNVVGGQYRSTIKFFGWAAHEQMAIRHLSVDWGDGAVQDYDDVKLKNHKPYCSVNKECYSPTDGFTGLTCETNNDCPLQAQACRSMGSCKDKQNLVCGQDSDCRRDGTQDTCSIRAFFGNSPEACEASPFEFSHVYACPANAASTLPSCVNQNLSATAGGPIVSPVPADVVAPVGSTPGKCYFGNALDSSVMDAFNNVRPTCSVAGAAAADCVAAYARAINVADVNTIPAATRNAILCGPPAVGTITGVTGSAGTVIPPTQARCSRDASRFCAVNADCAAGDSCIAGGMAPPNGCWDALNNACRFTPRVFLQDNWGWCTGECRAQRVGDTLQDIPGSPVRHAYGGCYTPVSEGADISSATRLNTEASNVQGALTGPAGTADSPALECAANRPTGSLPSDPKRNFRPWIVFPGSIQLRPTSR